MLTGRENSNFVTLSGRPVTPMSTVRVLRNNYNKNISDKMKDKSKEEKYPREHNHHHHQGQNLS